MLTFIGTFDDGPFSTVLPQPETIAFSPSNKSSSPMSENK